MAAVWRPDKLKSAHGYSTDPTKEFPLPQKVLNRSGSPTSPKVLNRSGTNGDEKVLNCSVDTTTLKVLNRSDCRPHEKVLNHSDTKSVESLCTLSDPKSVEWQIGFNIFRALARTTPKVLKPAWVSTLLAPASRAGHSLSFSNETLLSLEPVQSVETRTGFNTKTVPGRKGVRVLSLPSGF